MHNFHHNVQTKEKIRLALLGKKLSLSHKKNISEGVKSSEKYKISLLTKNKTPWNKGLTKETHPSLLRAATIISEKNKGRKQTLEDRQKKSAAHKRRFISGAIPNKRKNKKYLFNGSYFRSSWEVKVAQWLTRQEIKYEYETKKCIFELDDGSYYLADFYLPEKRIYIEVKGWWDDVSKWKFINAKTQANMCIVDYRNINNISLDITEVPNV